MCRCDQCGEEHYTMYRGPDGVPLCEACYDLHQSLHMEYDQWDGKCEDCSKPIRGDVYIAHLDGALLCEDCQVKRLADEKEMARFDDDEGGWSDAI